MQYNVFDIIGPVMIGPSSSHTAGAVRIGRVARQIGENDVKKVDFILHGSFAETYRGHGTDRALVAGLLGFQPDDERIRNAFDYAKKEGLEYRFLFEDLGDVHPNTAKIVMYKGNGEISTVTGSSIGGGNIRIIDLDGVKVDLNFENPTIVLKYIDKRGVIAFLSQTLYDRGYNIENLSTVRDREIATVFCEIDTYLDERTKEILFEDERFIFARYLSKRFR